MSTAKITNFNNVVVIAFMERLAEMHLQFLGGKIEHIIIADAIGVTPEHWLNIRNGKTTLGLDNICEMAKYAHTWPSRLLQIAECARMQLSFDNWHVNQKFVPAGNAQPESPCFLLQEYDRYLAIRKDGIALNIKNNDAWLTGLTDFFVWVIQENKE